MTESFDKAVKAAAEAIAGRHWRTAMDDARAAVTAYLDATQPTITTVEGLEGLPVWTIIVDATGQARRWEGEWWTDVTTESYTHEGLEHWGKLPARVIWRPHG